MKREKKALRIIVNSNSPENFRPANDPVDKDKSAHWQVSNTNRNKQNELLDGKNALLEKFQDNI